MKYQIEISTTKYVEIDAETEQDAKQKASELPLELNDFNWTFYVGDNE